MKDFVMFAQANALNSRPHHGIPIILNGTNGKGLAAAGGCRCREARLFTTRFFTTKGGKAVAIGC
jgi:hypothetical protein